MEKLRQNHIIGTQKQRRWTPTAMHTSMHTQTQTPGDLSSLAGARCALVCQRTETHRRLKPTKAAAYRGVSIFAYLQRRCVVGKFPFSGKASSITWPLTSVHLQVKVFNATYPNILTVLFLLSLKYLKRDILHQQVAYYFALKSRFRPI